MAVARQVFTDQANRRGPLREVMGQLLLLLTSQQGLFMGYPVEVLAQCSAGNGGQWHPGNDSGPGSGQRGE